MVTRQRLALGLGLLMSVSALQMMLYSSNTAQLALTDEVLFQLEGPSHPPDFFDGTAASAATAAHKAWSGSLARGIRLPKGLKLPRTPSISIPTGKREDASATLGATTTTTTTVAAEVREPKPEPDPEAGRAPPQPLEPAAAAPGPAEEQWLKLWCDALKAGDLEHAMFQGNVATDFFMGLARETTAYFGPACAAWSAGTGEATESFSSFAARETKYIAQHVTGTDQHGKGKEDAPLTPPYASAAGLFTTERGVVLAVREFEWELAARAVASVREHSGDLSVELWFVDIQVDAARAKAPCSLAGVRCRRLYDRADLGVTQALFPVGPQGDELAVYAVALSSFRQPLLLDVRTVALGDVNALFDSAHFAKYGMLMYSTWWDAAAAKADFDVFAWSKFVRAFLDLPDVFPAAVLVDKRARWRELQLALHLVRNTRAMARSRHRPVYRPQGNLWASVLVYYRLSVLVGRPVLLGRRAGSEFCASAVGLPAPGSDRLLLALLSDVDSAAAPFQRPPHFLGRGGGLKLAKPDAGFVPECVAIDAQAEAGNDVRPDLSFATRSRSDAAADWTVHGCIAACDMRTTAKFLPEPYAQPLL